MSVSPIHQWRLPGCGSLCWPRSHDPQTHHDHGYQLGYAQALRDLEPKIVRTGSLVVDLTERRVWVGDEEIVMYPDGAALRGATSLWALLECLARHAGTIVTRDVLAHAVMGSTTRADHHAIKVYTSRLRARLGPAGRLITTRTNVGLRLERVEVTP